MNTGIFSSTAQPVLLNYIRIWSELPAEQFALAPEDRDHLPPRIRAYVDNPKGEAGINVPLTATRQYLRKVELAEARLRHSLAWEADGVRAEPSHGRIALADLEQLHRLHDESLGLLRLWQVLTVQLSSARDIHSTAEQPGELQPRLDELRHFLLSRIGLARKAIAIGIQRVGEDETHIITEASLAKAIGAFFDEGQRSEFDSLPLELSLQTYLSA